MLQHKFGEEIDKTKFHNRFSKILLLEKKEFFRRYVSCSLALSIYFNFTKIPKPEKLNFYFKKQTESK